MRKDLNMRKGKMVAQGCHASMAAILNCSFNIEINDAEYRLVPMNKALDGWLNGIFTKICVGCDNEQELLDLYDKVKNSTIVNHAIIEDNGLTEFNGIKTKTCIAIGPDTPEKIDAITGHLKLL